MTAGIDTAGRSPLRLRRLAPLTLLLGGCVPSPSAPPPAPAQIEITATEHSFGTARQAAIIEQTFPFTNRGGTALRIERVRTGCDCTTTVEPPGPILPGESGAVRLRCDTAKSYGRTRFTATLHTNDPRRRAVLLVLDGTVELIAAAEPRFLYLGRVRAGQTATRSVELLLASGIDAPTITARSSLLRLATSDLGGRRGKQIRVTIADDAPPGRIEDEIRIATTSPDLPTLEVPVTGIVE